MQWCQSRLLSVCLVSPHAYPLWLLLSTRRQSLYNSNTIYLVESCMIHLPNKWVSLGELLYLLYRAWQETPVFKLFGWDKLLHLSSSSLATTIHIPSGTFIQRTKSQAWVRNQESDREMGRVLSWLVMPPQPKYVSWGCKSQWGHIWSLAFRR